MNIAVVNIKLNFQPFLNPAKLFSHPYYASAKPLEQCKNPSFFGLNQASTPNTLNETLNNYGKSICEKIKEIG